MLQRDKILSRGVDSQTANELCEDLGAIAKGQAIYFVWRPWLRDANDDMVLEAAVASQAQYIVTFNLKDFRSQGIEEAFGIEITTPAALLQILEGTDK